MSRWTPRDRALITLAGLLVTGTVGAHLHAHSVARQGRLNQRLVAAVRANHADAVAALLGAGADPNAWDTDAPAGPVLLDAVAGPDDRLVRLLLARGADPNERDGQGVTALMVAASSADPACVCALIRHGAEVNAKTEGGDTAWGYAASEGRTDNIAVLAQAGAARPAGLP